MVRRHMDYLLHIQDRNSEDNECFRIGVEFEIVAENVVDVGLRPGLIDKSVDYYVSVHISHQSKNIVKVIINGDNESINEFVDIIQREDVRVKKDTPKTYQVSELKEYLSPEQI